MRSLSVTTFVIYQANVIFKFLLNETETKHIALHQNEVHSLINWIIKEYKAITFKVKAVVSLHHKAQQCNIVIV